MTTTEITIKMILDRWNAIINEFDSLLNTIPDETLQKETAPGKNRGIYLLGHIIAVHDDMLRLLGMGDPMYPDLFEPFVSAADKTTAEIPSATVLRDAWKKQCDVLQQKFSALKPEEWFEKHKAISSDDFAKEPHRNKLNVILNRSTHLSYHCGQMVLLT